MMTKEVSVNRLRKTTEGQTLGTGIGQIDPGIVSSLFRHSCRYSSFLLNPAKRYLHSYVKMEIGLSKIFCSIQCQG
jgi:hypothetical protein